MGGRESPATCMGQLLIGRIGLNTRRQVSHTNMLFLVILQNTHPVVLVLHWYNTRSSLSHTNSLRSFDPDKSHSNNTLEHSTQDRRCITWQHWGGFVVYQHNETIMGGSTLSCPCFAGCQRNKNLHDILNIK